MPIRARSLIPAHALEHILFAAIRVADRAAQRVTELSAGGDIDQILSVLQELKAGRKSITDLKDVPGLAQYARDQLNDQGYDIVSEFQGFIALIDDAIDWIKSTIPTDGNGYALIYKIINDAPSPRAFSGAQTASLVTKLQAIRDYIQ